MNTTNTTKEFEEEKEFRFNKVEVYVKATYKEKEAKRKIFLINEHDEVIREETVPVNIAQITKAEIKYQKEKITGEITFDSKKVNENYTGIEGLINSLGEEEKIILEKTGFYQNFLEGNNSASEEYQGLFGRIKKEIKRIRYRLFLEQDERIINDLNECRNQGAYYQELQRIVKRIEEQETDKAKKEKIQELLSAIDRNEERCEKLNELILPARMKDMLGLRKV